MRTTFVEFPRAKYTGGPRPKRFLVPFRDRAIFGNRKAVARYLTRTTQIKTALLAPFLNFLKSRRPANSKLTFADLFDPNDFLNFLQMGLRTSERHALVPLLDWSISFQ